MHSLLLLLALARPVEVLEEWTLLDTAPLREVLTARVVYARAQGSEIAIPSVFSDESQPPHVELIGHLAPLAVRREGGEWRATLPESTTILSTPRPRVIVRAVRELRGAQLFHGSWPMARGEASRRVAIAPRQWMVSVSEGWTCADDSVESVACVSIDTAPRPMIVRVPARPTSRAGWVAAIAFVLAMFGLSLSLAPARARLSRGATFAAALLACTSVALTLVGAHLLPWGAALAGAAGVAAILAAVIGEHTRARQWAALALVAVPLLAVFDGSPSRACAALFAAIVVIASAHAISPERPRPALPRTDP